jgi:protein arginine N-methyltransferase 1
MILYIPLVVFALLIVVFLIRKNFYKIQVFLFYQTNVPLITVFPKISSVSQMNEVFFSEFNYYLYIKDKIRNSAYVEAIKNSVDGKVVIDIGTGPYALWAIVAAEYGAKKVFAIEEKQKECEQARAAAKKFQQVSIVEGLSGDIQLKQLGGGRCDVIVHELIGNIGSIEGVLDTISDANKRLLAPGGRVIPNQIDTYIAATEELRLSGMVKALSKLYPSFSEYSATEQLYAIKNFPDQLLMSDWMLFERLNFSNELGRIQRYQYKMVMTRSGNWSGFLLAIKIMLDDQNVINMMTEKACWSRFYVRMSETPIYLQVDDELQLDIEVDLNREIPTYKISVEFEKDSQRIKKAFQYN